MKIINADVEILTPLDSQTILKHIELCGRVCYKSEDKITEDSAARFVAGIIKRGHEAVLEHFNITVKFVCDRLCQLAEECAELAQAALKPKRVLDGRTPANTNIQDALSNLQEEEVGDVLICVAALSTDFKIETDTPLFKLERWVSRLEKAAPQDK